MNLKCIIQVIKCLTLGLLCPLTPFYYSSVENRGCKSSLTHWRFGNPLESWRKVCNINSIISSPSIFLAVKDKCRTHGNVGPSVTVTDTTMRFYNTVLHFSCSIYFFELWWTTNSFQFNLFFSLLFLIWLRKSSRAEKHNCLLIPFWFSQEVN